MMEEKEQEKKELTPKQKADIRNQAKFKANQMEISWTTDGAIPSRHKNKLGDFWCDDEIVRIDPGGLVIISPKAFEALGKPENVVLHLQNGMSWIRPTEDKNAARVSPSNPKGNSNIYRISGREYVRRAGYYRCGKLNYFYGTMIDGVLVFIHTEPFRTEPYQKQTRKK